MLSKVEKLKEKFAEENIKFTEEEIKFNQKIEKLDAEKGKDTPVPILEIMNKINKKNALGKLFQELLSAAVNERNIDVIRYCLKQRFDPMVEINFMIDHICADVKGICSGSALKRAIIYDDIEMVKLLLKDPRIFYSNFSGDFEARSQEMKYLILKRNFMRNTSSLMFKQIEPVLTELVPDYSYTELVPDYSYNKIRFFRIIPEDLRKNIIENFVDITLEENEENFHTKSMSYYKKPT